MKGTATLATYGLPAETILAALATLDAWVKQFTKIASGALAGVIPTR